MKMEKIYKAGYGITIEGDIQNVVENIHHGQDEGGELAKVITFVGGKEVVLWEPCTETDFEYVSEPPTLDEQLAMMEIAENDDWWCMEFPRSFVEGRK